jgi:hypothetical protein
MINAAYSAEAAPPPNAARIDNGARGSGTLQRLARERRRINQSLRGGLLSHTGQFCVELFVPLRRGFPGKIARHGTAH